MVGVLMWSSAWRILLDEWALFDLSFLNFFLWNCCSLSLETDYVVSPILHTNSCVLCVIWLMKCIFWWNGLMLLLCNIEFNEIWGYSCDCFFFTIYFLLDWKKITVFQFFFFSCLLAHISHIPTNQLCPLCSSKWWEFLGSWFPLVPLVMMFLSF